MTSQKPPQSLTLSDNPLIPNPRHTYLPYGCGRPRYKVIVSQKYVHAHRAALPSMYLDAVLKSSRVTPDLIRYVCNDRWDYDLVRTLAPCALN